MRISLRSARLQEGTIVALFPWMVAAAQTLLVASDTAVGPVVVRLSATHGVHLGDVAAGLVAADWAALVTVWLHGSHRA